MALAVLLLLAVIVRAGEPAATTQPVAAPIFPGSVESLDVCTDASAEGATTIHLLAGVKAGAEAGRPMTFHHACSRDGGATWSAPVRVDAGAPAPTRHHRGTDARIVAAGENLLAVWTTPGSGAMGTGRLATALSADGGRTWAPGPDPAGAAKPGATTRAVGDDAQDGYRFVALAAHGRTVHLLWLHAREKSRSLWATRSPDAGQTWEPATLVDPVICACCWNVAAVGPDVPSAGAEAWRAYALYRDMNPSDMGVARSRDGGRSWAPAAHAGSFQWMFEGCPHVGGGLAVLPMAPGAEARAEPTLLATVWTGKEKESGVYVLTSPDGGDTWSVPRHVGDASGAGAQGSRHSDAAALDAKRAAIVWDADGGTGKAIFASTSADRGRTWSPPLRLSEEQAKSPTHPRVVTWRAGNVAEGKKGSEAARGVVFWTESQGEAGVVRAVGLR